MKNGSNKKVVMVLTKIVALVNAWSFFILLGRDKAGGYLGSDEMLSNWQLYPYIFFGLLVFGIGGIILGLIIIFNKYEKGVENSRGFSHISTVLLIISPLLLLVAYNLYWWGT